MTELRRLHRDLLWYSLHSFEEGIEFILEHLLYSEEVSRYLLMEIAIARDDIFRLSISCKEESSYLRIDEILCLI